MSLSCCVSSACSRRPEAVLIALARLGLNPVLVRRGLEFLFPALGPAPVAASGDAGPRRPKPTRAAATHVTMWCVKMRQLGVGLVSVVVLAAACTDAEQRTPSRDETESPRSVTRDLSFVDTLAQLPAPGADEVKFVYVADLRALTAANDIEVPERDDSAAVRHWVNGLHGIGSKAALAITEMPSLLGDNDPDDFLADTGLSFADAAAFATVETAPEEFTILTGAFDEAEPAQDLIRLDEQMVSVGEGRDYEETTLAERHGADRLGRPVRIGRRGQRIALSLSTPMLRNWLDQRGPTLADDPSLSAIAEALDTTNSLAMYVIAPSTTAPSGPMGIGWGVDDGKPLITIAYDLGCDELAQPGRALVRELYEQGEMPGTGGKLTNLLQLQEVTAEGRAILVTLTVGSSGSAQAPLTAIFNGSLPRLPNPHAPDLPCQELPQA